MNTAASSMEVLVGVYYGTGHAVQFNFDAGFANVRGVGIPG